MQANLTSRTVWRHDGTPRDVRSDDAVPVLTLGERVLLSVALQTVCLVARADQLVARAHTRRGDRRAVRAASRSSR